MPEPPDRRGDHRPWWNPRRWHVTREQLLDWVQFGAAVGRALRPLAVVAVDHFNSDGSAGNTDGPHHN
jgi:hypothetical protein